MGRKADEMTMQLMSSKPSGTRIGPEPVMADTPNPDPDIKDHIGAKLQALYSEVLSEPVPDHLLDLVNKLEADDSKD